MFITNGVRKRWLVTGVAGFIGSNLLEALLGSDQRVRGVDNFSTGSSRNLQDVRERVGAERGQNVRMIEADICDWGACGDGCTQVDDVLQQAAVGSVPRAISNPIATTQCID